MFNQTKPPHSCLEILKLDSICQHWAEQPQSPSVCVRLASLTGNVSYLLRAILLLTQPNPITLVGNEVVAPILSSSSPLPKSPYHLAPITIEAKIEQSEMKAKFKFLKSTLHGQNSDAILRYVKSERAGKTLTDPILTRIQWYDPTSSAAEELKVQSEKINKIEREKFLE